ncbi:long-chain fatty acid--CoA ligase [Sphingorhabdus sp. IMCC26285]|uniref:Long-chain fatty acid--CoA ligase n=1 Tax=Sphingorhabdus profundilacus TaxID=2509718 RepID=A0A6I4LUH9_9SPHN|nr:long-chain fatty acid--CoA ligase [Sphingorhabdus profundilacus]MVZ97147.1 long-chain fatty acid--CoA ligase [Sphingorhabdus profundilacus]
MTNSIWQSHYLHPTKWDQHFAPLAMHDMFFQSAERRGTAALADFMGRKYSYAEMAESVRRVAKGLQDKGIGKGDHIGLFLPNVPHYIAAYYGALAAGATVVNFSPLYSVDELAHQVADSGTSILFTVSAAALLPTAIKVLDNSSLKELVVGSIAEALPRAKSFAYRLFKRKDVVAIPADSRITTYAALTNNEGDYSVQSCDPEKDIAQLQYTGGTTGVPKGAMLSHQNITANARQINMLDPHSRINMPDNPAPDRILGVLPFFHVFANATVLNRTIYNGGEIVMLPRFEAKAALAAVNRTHVTSLPGVPTMYQALLDCPDIAKTNFTSLRACISGGAPLAAELKARFEERSGAVVIEGYGLTESSGVVSCNPYEGLNKLGSIGQPIPGTDVKLLDKEDPTKPAPEGEPGELVFAGPQVMCGYWKRPDADAEVFVGKYLRTGDVATIDEDGFIHIVDRLKDMIAVGGFKVFPSQVEDVLYKHPAVKEALVIGVPDAYHGEMPRAFVTLQDGATEDGAALMTWLNPQLGKHERVQAVVVREALPKTMIGKLDRKALRAEIEC